MMPLGLGEAVLVAWACMAAAMVVLWLVQLRTGDASIVDVGWAYGTGAVGVALVGTAGGGGPARGAGAGGGDSARGAVAAAMVAVWSARLGVHLWRRVRASAREEGRYRYLREALGAWAGVGLFAFFQVQAAWAVMFAMPVWAAGEATRALDWLDVFGVAVWAAGVLGESVADRQLARFRADPRPAAQACGTGLWGGAGGVGGGPAGWRPPPPPPAAPRKPATRACGAGRGIPTTSSSGCSGGGLSRSGRARSTGG